MRDDQIDWDNIPGEADVVRWRLLAAGRQQILDHGLSRLTVEAIAGGARVAKPTFYTHFESRDAYLEALRLAIAADVTAAAHAAAEGPWDGVFARMIEAVVTWMREHLALAPLFSPQWAGNPSRPTRQPLIALVAAVLDAAERDGVLCLLDLESTPSREERLLATARFTLDILSGATDQVLAAYPDRTPVRAAEAFLARALVFDAGTAQGRGFHPAR